jgi:LmbE family N-acetylglucosaminyl deacetylase
MLYIFISPHLDDAILSCGGIMHALSSKDHEVHNWTIFAGDPSDSNYSDFAKGLHTRWNLADQNPMLARRLEDQSANQLLGAHFYHFNYQDCIYRKDSFENFLVQKEEDLFQSISGSQFDLVDNIRLALVKKIPQEAIVISPLAIGNHIDHHIVKSAVLKTGHANLWFYADYPYVVRQSAAIQEPMLQGFLQEKFLISEASLERWRNAAACYTSQISTFWKGAEEMFSRINEYALSGGGKILWKSSVNRY